MRLDWHKPYGTVMEWPGVRYQQDGHFFRQDGSPAYPETHEPSVPMNADPVDIKPHSKGWPDDDLRRPENKALKAQLEVYGEEWSTRKAALEFLQGRQT